MSSASSGWMLCTSSLARVVIGTHCSSEPWQCVSSPCPCLAHICKSWLSARSLKCPGWEVYMDRSSKASKYCHLVSCCVSECLKNSFYSSTRISLTVCEVRAIKNVFLFIVLSHDTRGCSPEGGYRDCRRQDCNASVRG